MLFVMYGSTIFSSVFLQLLREEIWACMMCPCSSLFGLGMIFASFQTCGMVFVFSAMLVQVVPSVLSVLCQFYLEQYNCYFALLNSTMDLSGG